jgi:hypothetical protein
MVSPLWKRGDGGDCKNPPSSPFSKGGQHSKDSPLFKKEGSGEIHKS